jgi:predicted HicB family RNase H-like nuclease
MRKYLKKGRTMMGDLLSYKNYNGTVEYSKEDKCFFGKVVGTKSLLLYEGNSVSELEEDFKSVIDEYIANCENLGVQPEISERFDVEDTKKGAERVMKMLKERGGVKV